MIITLTRDANQPSTDCTLGVMLVNERKFFTMERPWIPESTGVGIAGQPYLSCVSTGTYRLERRETEARGKHWMLYAPTLGVYRYPQDVPAGVHGRSLILIHAANYAEELHGCIAPGKTRFKSEGRWMVTESRAAMNELRTLLGNQLDLILEIK